MVTWLLLLVITVLGTRDTLVLPPRDLEPPVPGLALATGTLTFTIEF